MKNIIFNLCLVLSFLAFSAQGFPSNQDKHVEKALIEEQNHNNFSTEVKKDIIQQKIFKESKVFGFSQDIKITKNQKITVKLNEINEREFKTLLSK